MMGLLWKKFRVGVFGVLLFSLLTAIIVPVWLDSRRTPAVTAGRFRDRGGPVLVIDPGHGGMDGGASAADGTTENEINLSISLRLDALGRLLGFPAVLTRRSVDLDYPDPDATVHAKKVWDQRTRLALIRSTENAVLLSVHQNRYPDPRPAGAQVLYAKTDGSREFGELVHGNLTACFDPSSRRVAAPISDSIYLMKEIDCPGILVECGFLSNPAEAEKLKSDGYQTALAAALAGSYIQFLGEYTE